MANTIITKNSSTASSVPSSGDLVQGELAVNVTDKRLFTENSGGTVVEVGTNPSSLTLTSGTANGVTYLNGSKVLTSGSALTFDGTTLSAARYLSTSSSASLPSYAVEAGSGIFNAGASTIGFSAGSSELMRLTSTGLGIGTSAPSERLTVIGNGVFGNATTKYNTITINGGHVSDGDNDYGLTINSFEPAITLIDRSSGAGSGQIMVQSNGAFWFRADTTNDGTIGHAANTTDFVMVQFEPDLHVFNTSGSERLRITSAGNVGIGTSSPSYKLQIQSGLYSILAGADSGALTLTDATQKVMRFGVPHYTNAEEPVAALFGSNTSTQNNVFLGGGTGVFNAATLVSFYTASNTTTPTGSERMRIDSAGNVGIGTSSPNKKLHVQSGGSGASNYGVPGMALESSTNVDLQFMGSVTGQLGLTFGDSGNNQAGFLYYQNNGDFMHFATNGSERMRIDSSGRVGIGTSSPSYELDVQDAGDTFIRVKSTGTGDADAVVIIDAADTGEAILQFSQDGVAKAAIEWYSAGSPDLNIRTEAGTNGVIDFQPNNSLAMRLISDGKLLVGTAATFDNISYLRAQVLGGLATKLAGTGSTTQMSFFNDNGRVGYIGTSGTSTSYSTSSDYRLKEDWQPMTGASERVKALKPVNFAWKADGSRVDGFLAHEAQEVVPECVTGVKDAMRTEAYEVTPVVLDDEGNITTAAVMGEREVPNYQGIDQSKLVPLLTAALQEALTKIDSLTARIEALEGN